VKQRGSDEWSSLSALGGLALRPAASMLSGRGPNASLIILMFHRVLATPDPLLPDEPTAARFAAQMDAVAQIFTVLPLRDAAQMLKADRLPPRALCITFDDGYANNLRVAEPILARLGLPATIFVASGFLGSGRMFNDTVIEAIRRAPGRLDLGAAGLGVYNLPDDASRRSAITDILDAIKYLERHERQAKASLIADIVSAGLPSDLMMTEDDIREACRTGLEIGAHTVDHPILAGLEPATAERQIAESKAVLEDIAGRPVVSFAYPNGRPDRDYHASHVAMVRRLGFELAVSTAWGAADAGADVFQLPRVAPWDRNPLRFAGRLVRAYRTRAFPTAG
jgi:peptidoglycan/xylan/chitin deacetylase (PgdA/CDA1 family)